MKCLCCEKNIELNFFNLFENDFILCKKCMDDFEFLFYEDDLINVIFKYTSKTKSFLNEYKKGDYSLVISFINIIEFYIKYYLECKELLFYDCEFIRDKLNINNSGEYKYIFVLYLDEEVLNEVFLKYNFDFKIISLFASKKLINQRKKLLKML